MGSEDALARLALATSARPLRLGRYEVRGRLGRGGMGTVYDALDRDRGVRVAIKTFSEVDAAAAARVKREFRVVADLAHPNLAAVYELAEDQGLWFFAMEYIDGVGFTRWARGASRTERTTPFMPVTRGDIDLDATTQNLATGSAPTYLPEHIEPSLPACTMSALRAAMAELTRGLAALHDAGLRHGDVKPENVLVRDDGRVVLVDFGLAAEVGSGRARRGPTAGTPIYMAPEQLSGPDVGPAADWYAVGTMLYEVLTGRLPFDAESLLDLYFQKAHHTPASPRERLGEVPADLNDVCMALLRNVPERRPGGAELLRVFTGDEEARRRLAERAMRTVFVGRKRELRELEKAYGAARGWRPMVVHAIGPSGIGKSAMLRSFARGVEDIDGALVLRGRCYERESVPYNAFDGIVDELAEHLGQLAPAAVAPLLPPWIGELACVFPALLAVPAIAERALPADTGLEAVELRRRAWTGLRDLLAAIAHTRTVVLFIDDLHWADTDSAQLLQRMTATASRARLLVIAGVRAEEAAANRALADYVASWSQLTGEGRLVELDVGPLPPAEAELLARSTLRELGGTVSERRLRFLAEEASGVPFFIEELSRFVAARDENEGGEISLDQAIRARVQALPAEQRALLEVAAMADIPVPQSLLFVAAALEASALPSLLALRSASLVGWSGAGADDRVSVYHDRIRESVIAGLDEPARAARHLALGRAMTARHLADPAGGWAFEAGRHLSAAGALLDDPVERLAAARLARDAGRQARQGAAFPLAFDCFTRGLALLPPDAWETAYQLALDLHSGAAEAAYLEANWDEMAARCAAIKRHARTALDQIVAWQVEIDANIGRHEYLPALDAGLSALSLLGVELPRDPGQADVAAAFERALAELSKMTPESLAALPDVDDPTVAAAMRIQVRLSPGAFFGKPVLLPIIACNLVQTSVKRGLTTATPYALALFGIVLNTVGMYPVAHAWGQCAVRLLERWPDRRLEAATRHVVFNLVCPWMEPLATILAPLREVWDLGRRTGDVEYASYAAHGYVHNAMYVGRPLAPLVDEALAIGAQMRALGQVNALHVHEPFEQLLRGLTGDLPRPPRLDDGDFDEEARLAAAAREGSRSGCFILHLAIGLARFYLGDRGEASAHFEQARGFLDAAPSTWHIPILHQHAALAACAVGDPTLRAPAEASLAALRALAAHAPVNFAHRVSMVEAALARLDGDHVRARELLVEARAAAVAGDWHGDVALVDELAGDVARARDEYAAWGATAVADRLARSS